VYVSVHARVCMCVFTRVSVYVSVCASVSACVCMCAEAHFGQDSSSEITIASTWNHTPVPLLQNCVRNLFLPKPMICGKQMCQLKRRPDQGPGRATKIPSQPHTPPGSCAHATIHASPPSTSTPPSNRLKSIKY